MGDALSPDVCVIGAGSAGLTVAAAARAVGLSVVLIEKGEMGGECLNTGCVPSKALIAAARHAEAVRRAAAFGIDSGPPRVDAARVRAHVRGVIDAIAPHDSQARFEGLGATVIRAPARFVDPRTVSAGGRVIRARRFVVATGSRPALPDLPGLDRVPALTNETIFDLAVLPERLVVLGAGPVGLELAQAFRRLGSAVTVVARGRPLPRDHAPHAAVVADRLRAEGVEILERTGAVAIEPDGPGFVLRVRGPDGTRGLAGTHLLLATGRRPAVDSLGLDAAGIDHDGRGIRTDHALRTSNPRVFAIGDVADGPRFTHWAGHQGGLVVRTILTRWPHRPDPAALVWATFTDPEIAHVGLTEEEARARYGRAVAVHEAPFAGNDRAVAEHETSGSVRIVAGRGGRILGADIVGAGAAEMASLFALAIAGRLSLSAFAGMVAPYPTFAEAARRAALSAYAAKLSSPLVRAVLGVLRRLP